MFDLVENVYEWRSKERIEVVMGLFVGLRLLDTSLTVERKALHVTNL